MSEIREYYKHFTRPSQTKTLYESQKLISFVNIDIKFLNKILAIQT